MCKEEYRIVSVEMGSGAALDDCGICLEKLPIKKQHRDGGLNRF